MRDEVDFVMYEVFRDKWMWLFKRICWTKSVLRVGKGEKNIINGAVR